MTHTELRARITQREIMAWRILEEVDPWGQRREDYRTAMLASIVYNSSHEKTLPVSDFMLDFCRPAETVAPVTVDDSIAIIAAINAELGGRDMRKNKKSE